VRRLVEIGVLLGIAGTMASEFLVEGWLVPIVVSSGSMATTLMGPHRNVRCPDCGMSFACDAEDASGTAAATCPNCGRRGIPPDGQIIRGDRLLVDRATFVLRRPRRWEIALFRCPESADDYCVKRIVGLPDEAIEIRGGDVYVNGSIARKSLAQQRDMAVLVHDTAWIGGHDDLPDRWSPQTTTGWQRTGDGWRSVSPTAKVQWLDYIHWRRTTASLPSAIEDSPILDEDGYNQAVSRQLNRVTDLMLVCKLSAVGNGTLLVKANDGRETFQVSLAPATGAITLARSDRVVQSFQAAAGILQKPTELTISLIDQQIVVAIGSREEVVYRYEPLATAIQANLAPYSIGASDLDVQVSRLQIYRDVYYTPATRASDSKSCLLGPEEYYVLGDNSPISRDSRPWMGGEIVRGSLLVGRPLALFRRRENAD
jgi:signal peptidase I